MIVRDPAASLVLRALGRAPSSVEGANVRRLTRIDGEQTRRETRDGSEVPSKLPQPVVLAMAQRAMRMHHYLWHTARNGMRFFCGPALLIIDELGYLPLQAEGGAALFEVVQRRYLKGSIILTTNRGIPSWGQIFDDPMVAAAMLDRLLHRSVVLQIDGDSYRMRAHRARAELLRAASRP